MQTEQLKYKGAEDRIAENKLVDMRQTVLVVSCSLGKTVELICILCRIKNYEVFVAPAVIGIKSCMFTWAS